MDSYLLKNISTAVLIGGAIATALGTVGTLYFGKRVETVAPYQQPIHTGIAAVEVTVSSDREANNHYIDRGAYICFAKGNDELLTMISSDSHARQIGGKRVVYRAYFDLEATHPAIEKPINFLKKSEYIQIRFDKIPSDIAILSGKAICTFNSAVRIEINIPPQEIKDGLIFVHNLRNVFSKFPE